MRYDSQSAIPISLIDLLISNEISVRGKLRNNLN